MDSKELSDLLAFAKHVAEDAGALTLEYFKGVLEVEYKEDRTPVTIADRKAEELIRDQIQTEFPDHAIIGEEYADKASDSQYRWIIDPIDGTKSFIRGVPLYSILIACEYENTPKLGVIHIPPLKETVSAAIGLGCKHNNKPCRVSETSSLCKSSIHVTDFADLYRRRPRFTERLLSEVESCRTWGDAYGYFLVATGRADVMIDPIMQHWDIAPLMPIITEAGGKFTDLDGNPTPIGNSSLASNGKLHQQVLELL